MPAVPIENEIEFLSNYIELQRQRVNGDFNIECLGFKEVSGFTISPYLLVPLVENCFKHVSSAPGNSNCVHIECGADRKWFRFHTDNSIAGKHQEVIGGIGLVNIRKRLELTYPGNHCLAIDQTEDRFKVTLQLGLS